MYEKTKREKIENNAILKFINNRKITSPNKIIVSIRIIAHACIAAIKCSISVVIFLIVSEIFVLK